MDVRIDRQGTVAKDAWSLNGVLQQFFLCQVKNPAAVAKWTCEHKVNCRLRQEKAAWAVSAWLVARGNKEEQGWKEMQDRKKGILVVSFGTSYEETRKKTIDRIEEDVRESYRDYQVYRAWTSGMIRRKLQKRDGIFIHDVKGAMEQMKQDGIKEVIIQPTHMINGIENQLMTEDVLSYKDEFEKIEIGAPLLTSQEDSDRVVKAMADIYSPTGEDALVLMGHGSEHYSNSIYAALDYQFKDEGHSNIFIGTVEAYPAIESLIRQVEKRGVKRVILAPFMVVAGDHATNDLAGDEEDSWKKRFEAAGYEVRCVLRGLGEYEEIRDIYMDHIEACVERLEA